MSKKQDVLIVMTHSMKIKELEARQNAYPEIQCTHGGLPKFIL